jgi:hypothetical protein
MQLADNLEQAMHVERLEKNMNARRTDLASAVEFPSTIRGRAIGENRDLARLL